MKCKLVYFNIFLLLFSSLPIKTSNYMTLVKVAGGVVVTGFATHLACKSYHNSICYHKKIIEGATNVHSRAQSYNVLTQVLDKFFVDINKMSDIQRVALVNQPNEAVSAELCSKFNFYSTERYIRDLDSFIPDLVSYNKSLKRTVRKLEDKTDSKKLFEKAQKLSKELDAFLSNNMAKLEFLSLYLNTHKSYFLMQSIIHSTINRHKEALKILESNEVEKLIVENLKKDARAKFYNDSYYYLTYVEQLNNSVESLNLKFAYEYAELSGRKENLKAQLTKIRNHIVADKDYGIQREKAIKERQRQEQIKRDNELREREVRAKEAQAAASQQRADAATQGVAVKAAGLIMKQDEIKERTESRQSAPTVVVINQSPAVPSEA